MAHPRGPVPAVAIQDRSRLFREGLGLLLGQRSDVHVLGWEEQLPRLVAQPPPGRVEACIVEVAGLPWDLAAELARLRTACPGVVVVGTYADLVPPVVRVDGVMLVHRSASTAAFAEALQANVASSPSRTLPRAQETPAGAASLTRREFQVLALIAGGLTTAQMAERLGISAKTVEGKRQALFTKLGVQNQSAAVAVAVRTGLLRSGPTTAGTR